MNKPAPVVILNNRTCPCHQAVTLIDSADRLMHAVLRGSDITEQAKRWIAEREKCCPDCPSRCT